MNIKDVNINELKEYENNPRHNEAAVDKVVESIKEFGFKVPIIIDQNNVIVTGHTRIKAARKLGLKKVPCIIADDLSPEQIKAFRLADNKVSEYATWDEDKLYTELMELKVVNFDIESFGFETKDIDTSNINVDEVIEKFENEKPSKTIEEPQTINKLTDEFIAPPFSIFDTRQGYWQERKRAWKELGLDSGTGRDDALLGKGLLQLAEKTGANLTGTSIFDPVLCEIIYKWFNVKNGSIYDPFAGGSVRGIVAEKLGYKYTGIDLRKEQVEANILNAKKLNLNPTWHCDDSLNADLYVENNSIDLIFSCPPYADLEVYSDDERDISNMDYEQFRVVYKQIIDIACKKLKNDRFGVFVVGDVRDKQGFYRNFIDYTKHCFNENGLMTYNEIILLEQIATAALRCRLNFAKRKVTKTHQNVLVFYKGDIEKIKSNYNEIEVGDLSRNNLLLLEE